MTPKTKSNYIQYSIFLSLFLVGCGSSFKHSGELHAGRDLNIKGNDSSVNVSDSEIKVGRDIDICADYGLDLPNKVRAPRDVKISTECR